MNQTEFLAALSRLGPGMTARAAGLDEAARFPSEDIAELARIGALLAPLPSAVGGLGLGTEPHGAAGALALLRSLGAGNLAVGRVFEAHVNALKLIARYASPPQLARAARDAGDGCLFALWVTDPPDGGLVLSAGGTVQGRKQFCSGAGQVARAVVTAAGVDGATRLAVIDAGTGLTVTKLAGGMQGMRAATTGQVALDQVSADPFGEPGDYLREPDFSAGAWRTSAVTLGGLDALLAETTRQLRARRRGDDPHQLARMGEAFIAAETARLWMASAAPLAEAAEADQETVTYVNLARIAVERACLDAMGLVQRSLGVAAFLRPNPVERVCRDLATYLRQPAPDMVLTEAAAFRMRA